MNIAQALEQLQKFVFAIHALSADEWNDFALIWKPYEAKGAMAAATISITKAAKKLDRRQNG